MRYVALALFFAAVAASAAETEESIVLSGPIDERSAQRLEEEIAVRQIASATVVLNSPGGLLAEGIALGRVIRRLGFSTSVARGGICHSACVFALLGGVYRFADPGTSVGVHRFSSASAAIDADTVQLVAATVVSYIREMGAEVELFERMTRKGSDQMLILGEAELRQLRVINDGRRDARWALEVREGTVVLRGVQDTADGKREVLLSCRDDQVLFQPFYAIGARAEELANSNLRHLLRLGEGFVPLPEPELPLEVRDGTISATFALGRGQLKRLAGSTSIGYAIEFERHSSGFAIDTAGGGLEGIRALLANCPAR